MYIASRGSHGRHSRIGDYSVQLNDSYCGAEFRGSSGRAADQFTPSLDTSQ